MEDFGKLQCLLSLTRGDLLKLKDEPLAYSASINSVPVSLISEGKLDGLVMWRRRSGAFLGEVPPARLQIEPSFPEERVCLGFCGYVLRVY